MYIGHVPAIVKILLVVVAIAFRFCRK